MQRIIFLVISLLSIVNTTMAGDNVTGTFIGPSLDNKWTLDVYLTNDKDYVAFQMDITLPDGITVDSISRDTTRLVQGEDVSLNGSTVLTETPFVYSYNLLNTKSNTYRVTAYNLGNHVISGTSGKAIIRLLLQADTVMVCSDMVASFSNVDFIAASNLGDNSLTSAKAYATHMDEYLTITALDSCSTKVINTGNLDINIQYATLDDGWQDYTYGNDIKLTKNSSAWFRRKGTPTYVALNSYDTYLTFSSTGDIAASQSLMSLLDSAMTVTALPTYAFTNLFKDCTHLVKAPDLPDTPPVLACYRYMFSGCTSLTSIPAMPTTNLAEQCYYQMFYGCTSLKVNTIGPGTEWKITADNGDNFYTDMFTGTGGNFTGTPTKDVTYYVNDKPYTRYMSSQWGTIVLPYNITISDSDPYDLYKLTGISESTLTLTKITDKLPAGTPAIIRMSGDTWNADSSKYVLSLVLDDIASTTINNPEAIGGLTLTGVYTTTDLTESNGYIISNGAFWKIADIKGTNKVSCSPYRAYLAGTLSSGAKELNISVGDATGVSNIDFDGDFEDAEFYDLNGRRLDDLQPGVNIVKFRNGTTKKVIIR